jgi:hypothetical protein
MLKQMYEERFEKIYFLVPFYDGKRTDVISVFESSYQFQGYVSQAMHHIEKGDITHFLFIGDDLILNPNINQNNIETFFHNDQKSCMPQPKPLFKFRGWRYRERGFNAYQAFHSYSGTEYKDKILTAEEAFNRVDVPRTQFTFNLGMFFCKDSKRDQFKFFIQYPKHIFGLVKGINMDYPLYGGYSDIFMIRADEIDQVAYTFGVFAAMRLFVEIAIPTAMKILCSDLQEIPGNNIVMWTDEEKKTFSEKYNYSLKSLFEQWPEDCNYIHPIKLSKWKQ